MLCGVNYGQSIAFHTKPARFYQKFNIPGVLECIDCTQVAFMRPIDHGERYYCRKHYHYLYVQLVTQDIH
ncbi:unnamed protein product [Arctia plantaginis]|uniref:Uncharacterized protein n=1 Tax=Arctia plantaginis TaxID=874455 RepID=A0A8S0YWJ1_ARCPL|nr:unnamed protein product [Arctia plantaginis]